MHFMYENNKNDFTIKKTSKMLVDFKTRKSHSLWIWYEQLIEAGLYLKYSYIIKGRRPVDLIVRTDACVLSLQGEGKWGHMESQDVGCVSKLPAVEQTVH